MVYTIAHKSVLSEKVNLVVHVMVVMSFWMMEYLAKVRTFVCSYLVL